MCWFTTRAIGRWALQSSWSGSWTNKTGSGGRHTFLGTGSASELSILVSKCRKRLAGGSDTGGGICSDIVLSASPEEVWARHQLPSHHIRTPLLDKLIAHYGGAITSRLGSVVEEQSKKDILRVFISTLVWRAEEVSGITKFLRDGFSIGIPSELL